MGSPIIYATSDTHGNLPRVPGDADVLIMAGDICPDFRPKWRDRGGKFVDDTGDAQLEWLNTDFRYWLETLYRSGVKVVGIAGNHDFVFERQPNAVKALALPWDYLQDQETEVAGVRIYGTPWVPGLPYWAFYADSDKLDDVTAKIPKGLDVLVTHGPPYGAGDLIPTSAYQREKYDNFDGERVGSVPLRECLIEMGDLAPKLTVCGHIHEDRGMHQLGGTYHDPEGYNIWNLAAVRPGTYDLVADPVTRIYV